MKSWCLLESERERRGEGGGCVLGVCLCVFSDRISFAPLMRL